MPLYTAECFRPHGCGGESPAAESPASLWAFYEPTLWGYWKLQRWIKINEFYGYGVYLFYRSGISLYTGRGTASLASWTYAVGICFQAALCLWTASVAGADGKTLNYTVNSPSCFKGSGVSDGSPVTQSFWWYFRSFKRNYDPLQRKSGSGFNWGSKYCYACVPATNNLNWRYRLILTSE